MKTIHTLLRMSSAAMVAGTGIMGAACASPQPTDPLEELPFATEYPTGVLHAGSLADPYELPSPPGGFGDIVAVTTDSSGGVFVYDAKAPRLRRALFYYSRAGGTPRQLGGAGTGPGEYATQRPQLVAIGDGRVVLADQEGARLLVFDSTGAVLAELVGSEFRGSGIVRGERGTFHLRRRFPSSPDEVSLGWIHYDARGRLLDTTPVPRWARIAPAFAYYWPRVIGWLDPQGRNFAVWTGRLRVVQELEEGGLASRSALASPEPYNPEERKDFQRLVDFDLRGEDPPDGIPSMVPLEKPQIRAVLGIDWEGALWLQLHGQAYRDPTGGIRDPNKLPAGMVAYDWVEPDIVARIHPSNERHGKVTLAPGIEVMEVDRDFLWATDVSPGGEVRLVRWVIKWAS